MNIQPITEDFGVIVEGSGNESASNISRDKVIELLKSSGAVLFTGFDVDLDGFNKFAATLSSDFMTYKGGGYVRKQVDEGKDETLLSVSYDHGREKQDTFGLPLHGEMYYVDHRPVILWFYCKIPAASDGETTICDGSKVYGALSDSTREQLQAQRLKYIRKYLDGEWQLIYQTDKIDDAASFAGWNGLNVKIDREDSSIQTEYLHPAVITSRWGDHSVYINNVLTVWWQEEHLGRKTSVVRFEDGSKISKDIVDEVVEAQQKFVIPIAWKPKDFAVLDNTRALHGRRAFSDTDRDVYLRMVQSVDF